MRKPDKCASAWPTAILPLVGAGWARLQCCTRKVGMERSSSTSWSSWAIGRQELFSCSACAVLLGTLHCRLPDIKGQEGEQEKHRTKFCNTLRLSHPSNCPCLTLAFTTASQLQADRNLEIGSPDNPAS